MTTAVDRSNLYSQTRFAVTIPTLNVQVGFYTQLTGMSAQVDVMEYPEGGVNDYVHKLPGRIKHSNITLKRGVTNEAALLDWVKKTVVEAEPTNMSVSLYDSEGAIIQTWSFANAYPVKWTGPDVNAGGTEVMTESLEIAHTGLATA
jgi:phage tail-like protein